MIKYNGKVFFYKKKLIRGCKNEAYAPGSRLRPYGPIGELELVPRPRTSVRIDKNLTKFDKKLTNIYSVVKKYKKQMFVNKLLTILYKITKKRPILYIFLCKNTKTSVPL